MHASSELVREYEGPGSSAFADQSHGVHAFGSAREHARPASGSHVSNSDPGVHTFSSAREYAMRSCQLQLRALGAPLGSLVGSAGATNTRPSTRSGTLPVAAHV